VNIVVHGLTKTFRENTALENISLEVPPGTIFGLVGPNGAGKTTLIKIIMGLLLPTRGWVSIDGRSVHQDPEVKSRIGYLADYQRFYSGFKVKDMFRLYRESYEMWSAERFQELCRVFDLPENAKVKNLSKGMRTQLAIILNLAFRPALLVLDEPTAGLDPVLRRQFLTILMDEVAENGTTVFISTHNLHELERISDRLALIHQGRLLFNESLEDLKHKVRKIQAAFESPLPAGVLRKTGVLNVEQQGRVYSITMQDGIDELAAELRTFQPLFLDFVDISLEEIFIHRMGGEGYELKKILAQ
jgi:ABC-2 type transport system ATP-binding protein